MNQVSDDDFNNTQTLKDKVNTIENDFRKAIEICQAMLVYSKDKHFQSLVKDDELNQLKIT